MVYEGEVMRSRDLDRALSQRRAWAGELLKWSLSLLGLCALQLAVLWWKS